MKSRRGQSSRHLSKSKGLGVTSLSSSRGRCRGTSSTFPKTLILPYPLLELSRTDLYKGETKVHDTTVKRKFFLFLLFTGGAFYGHKEKQLFFFKQEINISVYQQTNERVCRSWHTLMTFGTSCPVGLQKWTFVHLQAFEFTCKSLGFVLHTKLHCKFNIHKGKNWCEHQKWHRKTQANLSIISS